MSAHSRQLGHALSTTTRPSPAVAAIPQPHPTATPDGHAGLSGPAAGAEALAEQLRAFLAAQPQVRIVDGQELLLVLEGEHSGFHVVCEGGQVVAHFWALGRSVVRRVVGARAVKGGLQLQALRFGQREPGPLRLESATGAPRTRGVARLFRAQVLAAIQREWVGWRLDPPSCAAGRPASMMDGLAPLEFFLFRRGPSLAAAVAAPPERSQTAVDDALLALLLWAGVLADAGGLPPARLMLVLPAEKSAPTLSRLPLLRAAARFAAYELDEAAGHLRPLSPLPEGNMDSVLRAAPAAEGPLPAAAAELWTQIRPLCPQAAVARNADGVAFRLHGLTFARTARGAAALRAAFTFGLGEPRRIPGWAGNLGSRPLTPECMDQFRALLLRLDRERRPEADGQGYLGRCQAEAWMEEEVRANLVAVAPQCDPRFIYAQVPSFRRGEREVMDLLAVERDGRLRILELKASEDLRFPLQALDYWRAVRHHQQRGDFTRRGYFPGVALRPEPPRLTLVAPALRWHPRAHALLGWLGPEVEVERAGVNEDWRRTLRVVERYAPTVVDGTGGTDV
ncbi:MAG: hypothetical protein ACRD2E_06485 [Terriglobales bacterium]